MEGDRCGSFDSDLKLRISLIWESSGLWGMIWDVMGYQKRKGWVIQSKQGYVKNHWFHFNFHVVLRWDKHNHEWEWRPGQQQRLIRGAEGVWVNCEAPGNRAHFLLTLLHAVFCRMTSLRRSNGGEPRPLRALDAQSTSSRCPRTWWETCRLGGWRDAERKQPWLWIFVFIYLEFVCS